MKIKKLLAVLSAIVMMSGTTIPQLPLSSYATENTEAEFILSDKGGDNITYSIYTDGTVIFSGTGAMCNWDYNNISGTSPLAHWGIKKVIIEEGITTIGNYMFLDCDELISVEIPDTVTSIGTMAFDRCDNLKNIDIPESVTDFGYCPFAYNPLLINMRNEFNQVIVNNCLLDGTICTGAVSIPDGVKTIEEFAMFSASKMASLEIPLSVTSIEKDALPLGESLTDIYYEGTEENWNNINIADRQYLKNINIYFEHKTTEQAEIIDSGYCGVINKSVQWTLDSEGTVVISGNGEIIDCFGASKFCKAKKVIIEDGVTCIGERAFTDCDKIESIEIPASVKTIKTSAFDNCTALKSITLPEGVEVIGEQAFKDCVNLESVQLPESLTSIGAYAFENCINLKSITIPKGITAINKCTFFNCYALENVDFSDNIKTIGEYSFASCGIKNLKLPKNLESIDECAFNLCKITHIEFNDNLKSIKNSFYGIKVESLVFPEGLETIGETSFMYCENLTSVYIPDSVKIIGLSAFDDCALLKNISYGGTKEQWKAIEIDSINEGLENVEITYNADNTATPTVTLAGDANCDGKVSLADATAILQSIANPDKYGLSAQGAVNADVDDVAGVTTSDALTIKKIDV